MIINENDYLAHHGIKGMKWGVRKDKTSGSGYTSSPKFKRAVRSTIAGAAIVGGGAAAKAIGKKMGYDFIPNDTGRFVNKLGKSMLVNGGTSLARQAVINKALYGTGYSKVAKAEAKAKQTEAKKKNEKKQLKAEQKKAAAEMKAQAKQLKKDEKNWGKQSNIDNLVSDAFAKTEQANMKSLQSLVDKGLKGKALTDAYTEEVTANMNKYLAKNKNATSPSGSTTLFMASDGNGGMVPVFVNNKK